MKKRAVAYCRVSSEHDDQLNSLENQKKYWETYLKNHDEYEFCDLYVDEGITGTSTLKRDGFNQMIKDALKNKFDVILTKEVSRFGRNIIDVLKYTRQLKEKGIGVFFQTDNINTLDNDGELRLSIMATLAQEESRKTSERVKWGHKRAMENGVVFGSNRILGYDIINKQLIVNEKEAELVKKIYSWFINGESLHGIVRNLKEMGIKNLKVNGKISGDFNHTTIRRILSNEKYCGDLKQKKYITTNFLTHESKKNNDDSTFITHYNHHPAIIDRNVWNKVQSLLQNNVILLKDYKIGYSKSIFGGKIYCGICGSIFRKRNLKNVDGSARPIWNCQTNYNKGLKGCVNGGYIREDILKLIMMDVFKKLKNTENIQLILNNIALALNESLTNGNTDKDIDLIKKQLIKIQTNKSKLLDLYMDENSNLSKDDFNTKNNELINIETELIKTINQLENRQAIIEDKQEKIKKFISILKQNINFEDTENCENVIEELTKEFLERIEVFKDNVTIKLLSGQYDIDLNKYPSRIDCRDYQTIMEFTYSYKKWSVESIQQYNISILINIA